MAGKKKNKAETELEQKERKADAGSEQKASIDSLSQDIKRRLDHMKVCLDDGGRPTMSEYRDMLKDLKTLRRRILGDEDGAAS